MQLPEIPLNPPLRKGETPCLHRTHVIITVIGVSGDMFRIHRGCLKISISPYGTSTNFQTCSKQRGLLGCSYRRTGVRRSRWGYESLLINNSCGIMCTAEPGLGVPGGDTNPCL